MYLANARSCYRLTVVAAAPYDAAAFDGIFQQRN
jgi:hypothetical protein